MISGSHGCLQKRQAQRAGFPLDGAPQIKPQRRPCKLLFVLLLGWLFLAGGFSQNLIAQETEAPRFEKEISAFEKADREHPQPPGQIVFVGSSSVRKWDLKKSFPSLDAINRGFGGSVISDSVRFFPRIVQPYQPRQVVFYAGDNDIGSKKSPQTVLEDFKKFVAQMHQHLPGTPMVFISIKPSLKRWNLIEQIREANALIKAECEKDPLLTFLDVEPDMLNEQKEPRPELFAKDGLHLSPEGYEVWAKLLSPHLIPDQRAGRLNNYYDKYHPWTPPQTLEEWQQSSEQIREQVLVANGLWPMPAKEELQPVVHGKVDRGDYTVERVYFASLPGLYLTGSLYRPKNVTGKIPAVLCPHGHWPNGRFMDSGSDEAKSQLKSGAEQFLSGARFPVQARMVQLARMGCVVFHYDMIGVADQGPLEHRGGFSNAEASLWLHSHMGLQTWNSMRALDFVTSLPDVDTTRIGVTGASGGGTQTFLLGAVDSRVTAAFPAVMVSTAMQGGCICENADYLRTGINNIAIAALFAPRPMAMSGAHDWTIDIETKGLPELRQIYSLYGEGDKVAAKAFPQFPHNYNQVAREMMYDWFNTHLQLGLNSPIHQTDFWPLTQAEMTVFDDTHPRPKDALKEPELRETLRTRDQKAFDDLLAGDAAQYRNIIGVASRVLLPPLETPVKTEICEVQGLADDQTTPLDFVIQYNHARVPFTLIKPVSSSKSERVVLWLDGTGKSHLRSADGQFNPAVRKLLSDGISVASADLFLTGDETGAKDLYESRMSRTNSSHVSDPVDKEYTGFVYGYNRTLLAERVRDIQAVVRALADMQFSEIKLVGSGDAGVWTLLARAGLPADAVADTTVDLQGFTFAGIKSNKDSNMLPGALKYGGIGGLAALAFPAKVTIYGASKDHPDELAPLTRIYQSQPGNLKISTEPASWE